MFDCDFHGLLTFTFGFKFIFLKCFQNLKEYYFLLTRNSGNSCWIYIKYKNALHYDYNYWIDFHESWSRIPF